MGAAINAEDTSMVLNGTVFIENESSHNYTDTYQDNDLNDFVGKQ